MAREEEDGTADDDDSLGRILLLPLAGFIQPDVPLQLLNAVLHAVDRVLVVRLLFE